jgi:valyl-tRNA synthetase
MPELIDESYPITLPEKPALEGLESKWNARWEADGTYRFDRTCDRSADRCTSVTRSRTPIPT